MLSTLKADHERFAAGCFVDAAGQRLPYRLLSPSLPGAGAGPFLPQAGLPLVLALHGSGERGTDNQAQLGNGVADLFIASRDAFPCVAVVPQCPHNQRWVEIDWGLPRHEMPGEPSASLRATLQLVEELVRNPPGAIPIDPERLYLLGISMGGYGVWDAVCRQPQRFAAAVPICGGAPEEARHAKAVCQSALPIWAFHGALDPVVPVERSRRMVAALRACGGSVRYTEYADGQHDVWTRALKDPELLPWLFAQRSSRMSVVAH
jgi:predicted peptidase